MRVKTDTKRREIVATAWELFLTKGFEATSMADVAQRLGGSKATLYRYFRSKDLLFAAGLEQAVSEKSEEVFGHIMADGDLRQRLTGFAVAYLKVRIADDVVGIDRMMIASADRSNVGLVLRAEFIVPHWQRLAAVFELEMAKGHLRAADPYLATMHFRGLLEGDILERRMFGESQIADSEIENVTKQGVDAFLRAYAPEQPSE